MSYFQGMVQGRTHRIKRTGRYLQPEELEEARREGEEISVSWEKMSKSKYNGVDPEVVGCDWNCNSNYCFVVCFHRVLLKSMEQILSGSLCCLRCELTTYEQCVPMSIIILCL